jgi:hypothetical protein
VEDMPAQEPTSGPTSASGPVVEPRNVTQFREVLYSLSREALDYPQSPQAQELNWITIETLARLPSDIEARYVAAPVYN